MKRWIYTFIYIGITFISYGQLYNNKWVAGDTPLSFIDFDSSNIVIDSLINYSLTFTFTSADICDENGNLLYITNGINIFDKIGDTLQNGTGINPCGYTDSWACCGLNIPQAALFIPQPGNTRYYYLLSFTNDDSALARPQTLYYSLIDKEGNGGMGTVIEKNIPLLQNTILREGGMTACKHANGRDYWITVGASITGEFYKFLITPDSILGPYTQYIGPEFPGPFDNAYSRFSQDGSKFVTGDYEGPVLVMDFDRCSGQFSNPITIYNQSCPYGASCSGSSSVEISPNNRFVYVATVITLTQYDLADSNIQDSVQVYGVDSGQFAQLDMLQLAPNGLIYLSSWNGVPTYDSFHVINNPDAKGDSCNFKYASQLIYSHNNIMPNMINYSLGALVGSGCDTIPVDTILSLNPSPKEGDLLRVMPCPADKFVYVEMGQQGNYEFGLLNSLGQVMDKKETPQVDIFNTGGLASGVYFIKVIDKSRSNLVATKKVVVMH